MGQFGDRNGLEPHNSFVQCYSESGLPRRHAFLRWILCLLGIDKARLSGPRSRGCRTDQVGAISSAVIVSYIVGTLTSNRTYQLPTYMLLGLATAYIGVMEARSRPSPILPSDQKIVHTTDNCELS